MFDLEKTRTDVAAFLHLASQLLGRALASSLPSDLRVVHIDNWFGPRWRHFAGKVLGALGTRSCERLVVPPFAPGRVLSEQAFTCTTDDWVRIPLQRPLHIRQHSEDNRRRFLDRWSTSGIFFWYSASTTINGRGSIMLYEILSGASSSWYASFRRDYSAWVAEEPVALSPTVLDELAASPPAQTIGSLPT